MFFFVIAYLNHMVGYNKKKHVFLINFNHMAILLKRGVLVALNLGK